MLLRRAILATLAYLGIGLALTATSASAWSNCFPRTTAVPQGTLSETAPRTSSAGGRLLTLTFQPPAMQGTSGSLATQRVHVLLPEGYDAEGDTRYPVLYLLHGALDSYLSWPDAAKGNVIVGLGDHQLIVVMPDGGNMGAYTDWWGMTTAGTANQAPQWESYHLKQLVPWIDANFPTIADRDHRAIAGLSMGGAGAMKYASRRPDLFGFAGSFSGAIYTDMAGYPATDLSNGNLAAFLFPPNPACKWGSYDATPPNMEINWRDNDPTYTAENLASLELYLSWGTGSDATENVVRPMSQAFATATAAYGISTTVETIAGGVHNWANWRTGFAGFIVWLADRIGQAPPVPEPFDYRSALLAFGAHGWSFTAQRGGIREFTYLSDVSRRGLTAIGSGQLQVTTAPLYGPEREYFVVDGEGAVETVTSDVNGQLGFTVDLGPAHVAQQSFPASLATFDPQENAPPVGWVQESVRITSLRPALAADPVFGAAPLEVLLDASGTVLAAGASPIEEYRWDFDGDGEVDEVTSTPTVSHTYLQDGVYEAEVTIVADEGTSEESATATITVETPVDLCGNGELDAGEECDLGDDNDGVSCCRSDCTLQPADFECRAATDACDVGESCDGASELCPADDVAPAGTVCRDAAGVCDTEETCDGASVACPADDVEPAGTVCRDAAGVCDVAETCDGASVACPADEAEPAGTVCRPAAGACDLVESCDGASTDCPVDDALPDGDGDGVCGADDNCPVDPNPLQEDDDGDGQGNVCDACTNIASAPVKPTKIVLSKLNTPPGDDQMTINATFLGVPTSPPVDPVTNGVRIRLERGDGSVVVDAAIPGGAYSKTTKIGWTANKQGTMFRYNNKSPATIAGVTLVSVARTKTGQTKVTVRGKQGSYPVAAAGVPLKATFVLDAPTAETGQCGETAFAASACKLNKPGSNLTCK